MREWWQTKSLLSESLQKSAVTPNKHGMMPALCFQYELFTLSGQIGSCKINLTEPSRPGSARSGTIPGTLTSVRMSDRFWGFIVIDVSSLFCYVVSLLHVLPTAHQRSSFQSQRALCRDYLTFRRVPVGISRRKKKSLSLRFLLTVGRPGGPA